MPDARPIDGPLPVGYRLDDFRIVAVLGQGGFGVTYKAMDERLERAVAVKEYLPAQFAVRDADATVRARSAADEETFKWGLGRFIDEARVLARFKHPNIVAVIRYFEANGTAYLVMEYEEGRDLEKWLAARGEPPDEETLVNRILWPVLDGLEKIHAQGLLHRDIKPDNVFIRKDNTPVLIDFGASRAQGASSAPMTSIVSAGYSPFEQYGTGEGQGPWSDLYALAGTMYRVVTGKPPADAISRYQGAALVPAAEAARGRYSAALLNAIDQGLALNAQERPQSAAALRQLIGGRATTAAPPAAQAEGATQVRRPTQRIEAPPAKGSRVPLVLGALVLLAAAGAGTFYYLGGFGGGAVPGTVADTERLKAGPARPVEASPNGAKTPSGERAPTGESTPATDEPITEPVSGPVSAPDQAPPAQAAPTEDDIVADWVLSEGDRAYRKSQIGGALLAYVSNRQKFDDCLKTGCAEQVPLMSKVQEALDGYVWKEGALQGELQVTNPRRIQRPDCMFLLDLVETIRGTEGAREQTRSYCTTNGFDRSLQSSGAITQK